MKLLLALLSPRPESSTSKLALRLAQGAREHGAEVVTYRLSDMNVKGCQACRYCKEHISYCVVEDDLVPYWADLESCDALVLAAPNYMAHPCGPAITFMNRHYCLGDKDRNPHLKPGRKMVGIFSQGRDDLDLYRGEYAWYLGHFQSWNFELVDTIIHASREELVDHSPSMQRAYTIGQNL